MGYQYSDYPAKARRLADAGQNLLEALQDPSMDRGIAISDVEAATTVTGADLRLGFDASAGGVTKDAESYGTPDDTLSGLLLELQSANVLMSAGIALNEHGGGADGRLLQDSIGQISSSRSELESAMASSAAKQAFAPQEKPSGSVGDAVVLFRSSAERTLTSITEGTDGVINSIFKELKKLDGSKVLQAIDNLGQSFAVVASAGRLLRQGMEKLKSVLDALSKLFGADVLAKVKAEVKGIWEKFTSGQYTKDLVRSIAGIKSAEDRISEIAKLQGLEISRLDGVSRKLAGLEDRYQGNVKILNGLIAGVVTAMAILAFLHLVGPWLALAAAGAYAAILAGSLVVAINYCGCRHLLNWVHGVCDIIEEGRPRPVQS
jgi:hypothetical protein